MIKVIMVTHIAQNLRHPFTLLRYDEDIKTPLDWGQFLLFSIARDKTNDNFITELKLCSNSTP